MGAVLGIIAIAVLMVLIVASARVQLRGRGAEKQLARDRANVGQEQHESSLRRRAEVRAAPAEHSAAVHSPTGE